MLWIGEVQKFDIKDIQLDLEDIKLEEDEEMQRKSYY